MITSELMLMENYKKNGMLMYVPPYLQTIQFCVPRHFPMRLYDTNYLPKKNSKSEHNSTTSHNTFCCEYISSNQLLIRLFSLNQLSKRLNRQHTHKTVQLSVKLIVCDENTSFVHHSCIKQLRHSLILIYQLKGSLFHSFFFRFIIQSNYIFKFIDGPYLYICCYNYTYKSL